MDKAKSYGYFILSMVIFGTIGIFRRYIPLSSSLLAMIRGFVGSLFLLLALKRGKLSGIRDKRLVLIAISGLLIGLNWMALFESYNYTTVARSTLAYYMQPTIVVLLSPIVFKEKLSGKKLLLALLALLGMALISGVFEGGGNGASELKGIGYGLVAAVLYAIVVMLNKKLTGIDAGLKTIVQLFFAGVSMLPYVFLNDSVSVGGLSLVIILLVLVVGIVHTGLAYSLYFGAIEGLKAQSIALLSYIDPLTSLLLSFLVLRESLTVFGVIGAIMIIGSALASEFAD